MKKILALILILASLAAFVSCGESDDTPDGMKLVFGGDDAGYYFYAPEEWLISNVGGIKAAYISTVNTTSVSFAEVELDEVENKENYFFESYFNDHLSEFTGNKIKDFTLKENGKNFVLGTGEYAADRASQYIYTYKYPSFRYDGDATVENPNVVYYEFCFMQILAMHEGRFYILTYSAQNEAPEGQTPNYEKYLEKFTTIIENFRFVDIKNDGKEEIEYEYDEDGYKCISDKDLAGFKFYVPKDFNADYSSAIVSATHEDGSNVNITQATAFDVAASDYWIMRRNELSNIVTDLQEIRINEQTRLGNNSSNLFGDRAYLYEYTYTYDGQDYHVYQIIAINGSKVYAFTFTATEENYQKHIESVEKIVKKVKF